MRPDETWSSFEIEVFYDGACPLCAREIEMLKRKDQQGRIRFTDIDQLDFQSATLGKTYDELMDQIHARLPDGTWIRGVDVFRRLYAAIGFGFLVRLSRLMVVSQLLDVGYWLFAKNRLRLTGRCTTDHCSIKRHQETSGGSIPHQP